MWPFDLNFWRGFWEAFGQWPLQTTIVAAVAMVLIAMILSHTYIALSKWREGVETRRLEAFGNLIRQNELLLGDVDKLRKDLHEARIQSREMGEQNVELHTRLQRTSKALERSDSLVHEKEKLLTESRKYAEEWCYRTLEAVGKWSQELLENERPYDGNKAYEFECFVAKLRGQPISSTKCFGSWKGEPTEST